MITSCTFLGTGTAGVHDSDALSRQYDIVMASSVMNALSSHEMIAATEQSISDSVRPGGMSNFNFPMAHTGGPPGEKGS